MERTTTSGETIEVKSVWKGDAIVMVDSEGNEYGEAGSGKIKSLAAGETPTDPDLETEGGETEEVETEEAEEASTDETEGSDEDGAQGGATEEPVG